MSRVPIRTAHAVVWVVALWVGSAGAARAGEALRISGVIDQDATWRGQVFITGSTQIVGASVSVAPGCNIEFAGAESDPNPVLAVGAPEKGGRLLLLGSREAPIRISSRRGTKPGSIRVFVPARDTLDWHDVQVEYLGYRAADAADGGRSLGRKAVPFHVPAVQIEADAGRCDVRLEALTFTRGTRVSLKVGPATGGSIRRCRFEEGGERLDLELLGAGRGAYAVIESRFGGAVEASGVGLHFSGNLMIGPRVAVAIQSESDPSARLSGNYIHNTTTADDGSYCLKCRDPRAIIEDNVLRGGTYVVLEGSRQMSGNVLVAAGRLASSVRKSGKTHYLVGDVPDDAVFENNVLLGPAYAHVAISGHRRVTIRRNVFDGMGDVAQAIRLNVLAREALAARIVENTFLRTPMIVLDEARVPGSLAELDRNLIAPRPTQPTEGVSVPGGAGGLGPGDRVLDDLSELGLADLPAALPADWDGAVTDGRRTIMEIRAQLRAAYGLH